MLPPDTDTQAQEKHTDLCEPNPLPFLLSWPKLCETVISQQENTCSFLKKDQAAKKRAAAKTRLKT